MDGAALSAFKDPIQLLQLTDAPYLPQTTP